MTDQDEQCTATKANGEPCEYSAKYDDGKCGIHTDMSKSGGPGRETKFNGENRELVIGAAEQGAKKKECAQIAGVTRQTLNNWLNRGEEDDNEGIDSAHASFFTAFNRARARGALKRLEGASDEFVLERSYGYTKTERHEVDQETTHSGEVSHTHQHEHELTEKQRNHFNQLIDRDE